MARQDRRIEGARIGRPVRCDKLQPANADLSKPARARRQFGSNQVKVVMMSGHFPGVVWFSGRIANKRCDDTVKLAVFEIVVDIILLCGIVATANAPLM